MVMEAPPSPQSVGREFVRQYYTLLNKAPNHLHRFYNHQSSFIHGGLDPPNRETAPVIGQKQIHQKIQQLNFRDCHAKITQVDSQSTLGNGVVVQVTGELSNAGHPMRRFTQTFVLAAQSPKKYYVHNDIFRYQDEIISDEECDDNRSDVEEEVPQDRPNLPEVQSQPQPLAQQQPVPAPQAGIPPYYGGPASGPTPAGLAQLPPQHLGQVQPPTGGVPPVQQQHVLGQPPVQAAVNGHPEEMGGFQGQVPLVPQVQPQNLGSVLPMAPLQPGMVQPSLTPPAPIEEIQPQIEEHVEEPESAYIEPEQEFEPEIAPEQASNEPKTYANLLKSSPNTSLVYNSVPMPQPTVAPQYGRPASPPVSQGFRGMAPRQQGGLRGVQPQQQQQGQGRPQMGQGPPRQDGGRSVPQGKNSFYDDAPPMKNNDGNQLFLGNLPHNASDDEIRDIFAEYGTIVELRILSKPVNKGGPPGPKLPPNYGFITFETQQGLQKCLTDRPIFYPKNDKNGTQLNVEEKRTKLPYQGGGGRPSFDNRNRTGDSMGQRRGGPGGPGGPGRNPAGGPTNGPNNRNNSYNRGGGPPSRGGQQNSYNRR